MRWEAEPDAPAPPIARQLALRDLGDGAFEVPAQVGWSGRLFGGVLIGSAVRAAAYTVDRSRGPHSVSVTFHRPGESTMTTRARVEHLHDGRSFSTRDVRMTQGSSVVATATVSFHSPALGRVHHAPSPRTTPPPSSLPPPGDLFADDAANLAWARWLLDGHAVEARFPTLPARVRASRGEASEPRQSVWMRTTDPLPGESVDHAAALGYLSDVLLLSTALGPHRLVLQDERVQFATLSHTVWFHEVIDVHQWFLYEQESRWAGADRALCRGEVFDLDGRLLASTAQEGLLRVTA